MHEEEEARDLLLRARALSPENVRVIARLAFLEQRRGDTEAAEVGGTVSGPISAFCRSPPDGFVSCTAPIRLSSKRVGV